LFLDFLNAQLTCCEVMLYEKRSRLEWGKFPRRDERSKHLAGIHVELDVAAMPMRVVRSTYCKSSYTSHQS
jgi:hypothetical protein